MLDPCKETFAANVPVLLVLYAVAGVLGYGLVHLGLEAVQKLS